MYEYVGRHHNEPSLNFAAWWVLHVMQGAAALYWLRSISDLPWLRYAWLAYENILEMYEAGYPETETKYATKSNPKQEAYLNIKPPRD